jgi:hypothetical protein
MTSGTHFYDEPENLTQPEINISKQPEYEIILQEIKLSDNQVVKGMPMEVVIKHFETMTKRKSENGNPFLRPEQLIYLLKYISLGDTPQPKQKINCTVGEKGFVIKRFYEFYALAVSEYNCPPKKEKFIKLFTDCFDNWDAKTLRYFFYSDKAKNNW